MASVTSLESRTVQDPVTGRFTDGHRAPRRLSRAEVRAAVEARAHNMAREFGGWSDLGETDRGLLLKASELLQRPTRGLSAEQSTRIANSVDRIVRGLRKRHARPKLVVVDSSGRTRLK